MYFSVWRCRSLSVGGSVDRIPLLPTHLPTRHRYSFEHVKRGYAFLFQDLIKITVSQVCKVSVL